MNSWSGPCKQFERGEGLTPEQSRANLEKKKADWLKQQKP
jgi:hypothetical protein